MIERSSALDSRGSRAWRHSKFDQFIMHNSVTGTGIRPTALLENLSVRLIPQLQYQVLYSTVVAVCTKNKLLETYEYQTPILYVIIVQFSIQFYIFLLDIVRNQFNSITTPNDGGCRSIVDTDSLSSLFQIALRPDRCKESPLATLHSNY